MVCAAARGPQSPTLEAAAGHETGKLSTAIVLQETARPQPYEYGVLEARKQTRPGFTPGSRIDVPPEQAAMGMTSAAVA
jgi:hypothetical protein